MYLFLEIYCFHVYLTSHLYCSHLTSLTELNFYLHILIFRSLFCFSHSQRTRLFVLFLSHPPFSLSFKFRSASITHCRSQRSRFRFFVSIASALLMIGSFFEQLQIISFCCWTTSLQQIYFNLYISTWQFNFNNLFIVLCRIWVVCILFLTRRCDCGSG